MGEGKTSDVSEETTPATVLGRFAEPVFALDEEWRFTYLNEPAEDALGRNGDDLLGTAIWDLLPDQMVPTIRERFELAADTGEAVTAEEYYPPSDVWFEMQIFPAESGFSVLLSDVTEEVDRRTTLESRERALKDAYEIIADPDRPFEEQIADLLEVVRETVGTDYATLSRIEGGEYVFEAVAAPVDADVTKGDSIPLSATNCERVVETERTLVLEDIESDAPELAGRAGNVDLGISCYLGAPVFVGDDVYGTFCFYGTESRAEEFTDWQTAFVELLSGWVSSALDRRTHERELRDANSQLEAATEAGAVGTWEWDVSTDEIVANPSFAEQFGIDPDVARDGAALEAFVSAIHENDRERVEAKIQAAVESCGEYEAEYRVRNSDGEFRWVVARGHVDCDDDGTPRTFPGALTDVTERKRTEKELQASNERLEQFAYAASHDLQEPLRMVSSYLRLVERRYADALDEEGEEFIDFAVDGAERMREMIESLLAYSRVETRGNPLEPVDVGEVLADVRVDLQFRIEETDADITTGDLPRVVGDPDQLRQLFQNLLDNAMEYRSGEAPQVTVSADRSGGEWVISVSDEGIGIDPEDQRRIFEVFQRLHTQNEHAGTGIGLALCERIVERHGGDIWVDSEPGEGATLSFTLPAANDSET
ncbi:PAS domain S-box-containing protein [Halopelagius inordinatus]|uniref:histidine kinase n=1 Tax=Halopelagius inordinatus TaxID=553467 RepID=A0A1I2NET7_9EURY|nr:ATP-binding protein [Halopelagius inordinatus]SFG02252.1 PAS domain S-box-containing protein [Halopelagius inordinatus]